MQDRDGTVAIKGFFSCYHSVCKPCITLLWTYDFLCSVG